MARRSHMISEPARERDRRESATRRKGKAEADQSSTELTGLRSAFEDIIFAPLPDARSFFTTAGIGWMLDKVASDHLWSTFRDHYTTGGKVDVQRFCADLVIWPPIASRIAQLQQGRS